MKPIINYQITRKELDLILVNLPKPSAKMQAGNYTADYLSCRNYILLLMRELREGHSEVNYIHNGKKYIEEMLVINANWSVRATIALRSKLKKHILLPDTEKEKERIQKETENFFRSLIKMTDTYFLSDYVEHISEHVSKEKVNELVNERNILREKCKKAGLNIHQISISVSNRFLRKLKIKYNATV